jgi:hypothetical protein
VEKIIPLGREQGTLWQAMDCFAMERSSSGPLGKDLHADGSRIRDSRGCSLECSKKWVAVDDVELEVDESVQELAVFRKLLYIFEVSLVWACRHRAKLGLYSSLGLKGRMGRNGLGRLFKSCFGLGWMRLRVGSSKVGCRPYSKKTTKSSLDLIHGFNAFFVGLSSSPGMFLGSASLAVAVGSSSPARKALGYLLVEFPVSSVHASSSPPKVSSPAAVVEKFSAAVPQ